MMHYGQTLSEIMVIRIYLACWLSVDNLRKCEFRHWCRKYIEDGPTKGVEMPNAQAS